MTLAPLQPTHAPALARAAADGALWEIAHASVPTPSAMRAYVDRALDMQAAGDAVAFVAIDASGEVVGTTRFYRVVREVPRVTIGYTWYAASAQRTGLNTEAKRMLLAHAFDVLGCAAVGFETSHLNLRSQAAITRLGARLDGVLRAHMRHADGSLRDTHSYSIVAAEWPAVRERLDTMLETRR